MELIMNNTVKTTLLAFLLGFSAFASAGHHSGATHEGTQVKHVGFSQMGDPATVLEVKTEASAALRPGDWLTQTNCGLYLGVAPIKKASLLVFFSQ